MSRKELQIARLAAGKIGNVLADRNFHQRIVRPRKGNKSYTRKGKSKLSYA